MAGKITMSARELDRLEVVRRVVDGRLSQLQAATLLDLTARQVRRLCRDRAHVREPDISTWAQSGHLYLGLTTVRPARGGQLRRAGGRVARGPQAGRPRRAGTRDTRTDRGHVPREGLPNGQPALAWGERGKHVMRSLARWSITWIAVATALLAACGGGGEEPAPPAGFTAAMVQGKTFYRERLTAPTPEKMLITFTSATAVTVWQDQGAATEIPGTWSIDSNGRLVLQSALGRITVTLVGDEATYMDVSADDGTGAETARLHKTVAFGAALLDRFTIADRDLAGTTVLTGVGAFASSPAPPPNGGGTMVSTDGFEDGSGPWSGNPDGSVTLADKPGEETVVYLRADSVVSSPKVLHVVGRVHSTDPPAFLKVADAILAETPAKAGFTPGMVEGSVVYREAGGARSLIRYLASGVREEWYEDAVSRQERLDGTWVLTPLAGSLRAVPGPGIQAVAAMLVEDLPTRWDVLANSGTVIRPLSIQKTIPFGATLPDRFVVADRDLAGTAATVGVAAFEAGFTGVFTDGFTEEPVAWTAEADGSITLSSPSEENVLYLRADSTTGTPKSLNVVGRRYDAGTTAFTGVVSLVLAETPAKAGFTAGMVEGRTFFRDGTPASRSVVTYLAGGVREEWYEDAVPSAQHRVGTWSLTPLAGALIAVPVPGDPGIPAVGAMLIEDGTTQWSLLVNTGTGIRPASLQKTVAATASQWFTYTWSVTQHTLAGGTIGPYPITIGEGTGIDSSGRPFTWGVQADGSILVSWLGGDRLTIHQLESSAPPTRLETACVWAPGGTYGSLLVQTFAR